MRSRRGFFLMELLIGFAILVVVMCLAAAVVSQSRISEQKLVLWRSVLRQQQNVAWQMLITGNPSTDFAGLKIQAVSFNQSSNVSDNWHWISISQKTPSSIMAPIFVLAPAHQSVSGGQ